MSSAEPAAGPPQNDLDAQIDEMFDRADDLMINQNRFDEAVSIQVSKLNVLDFLL